MATMTQLFKLVIANDYETIEMLINSNQNIDFNCIKSGISLVTKAIEVRSIECFNLLLECDKLTILQSNNLHVNGLSIAIDYFSTSPNLSNKYFIDRLFEKNVFIDNMSVCNCMNNMYLFDIMFSKMDKTYNNMHSLFSCSIQKNNTIIMHKLFNYLNETLDFYNTHEKRHTFNINVFKSAILENNLLAIEHLYSIKTNLLCVITTENIPSLYYTLLKSNNIIFNYIYSLYEQLDSIQLNEINYIDKLNILVNKENITTLYIKQFFKILSLPIKFNKLEDVIIQLYRIIYNNMLHNNNNNYIVQSNNIQLIMYMIFKTNQVKVNPYIKLVSSQYDLDAKRLHSITQCKNNTTNIYNTNRLFRRNKYILNHFGFIESEPMAEYYKSLFDNSDKSLYKLEEKETMQELENNYNNIINQKIKSVKSKKKLVIIPFDIIF
jgi:hypothetical protein